MLQFNDADNKQRVQACFAIMSQLRDGYSEDRFHAQVTRQQQNGYVLSYGQSDAGILVVAGWRLRENLAMGSHIYIEDLVTDQAARSRGHGEAMINHLLERGRQTGCGSILLDSGVQRHATHRFYLREHFDIRGYLFMRSLD